MMATPLSLHGRLTTDTKKTVTGHGWSISLIRDPKGGELSFLFRFKRRQMRRYELKRNIDLVIVLTF